MAVIPMSEDALLSAVLGMAKGMRVLAAHFRPALTKSGRWITPVQGDGTGFLDLVLAGLGGVKFRELKSDTGRLSPEQKVWMVRLDAAGADVGVWRPADLRSGRIEAEMRSISKPRVVAS